VVDLQAKMAIAKAELSATTSEMNKRSGSGIKRCGGGY
jgi:hypothetical protein